MTGADLEPLKYAHASMIGGDPDRARSWLKTAGTAFALEIESLIRAGHDCDAVERLHLFINPKYPTTDACKSHVGNAKHFHTKQGSLL